MEWFEKWKRIRGFPLLCAGLVLGLVLLCIPHFLEENEEVTLSSDTENAELLAYSDVLAHKIAQMAEALHGVSEAEVLVTMDSSSETVYAQEASAGGTSYLLASGNEPVRLREVSPQICGIAVVCVGGDDPQIQAELISMLTAAFHLPASRIYIGGK